MGSRSIAVSLLTLLLGCTRPLGAPPGTPPAPSPPGAASSEPAPSGERSSEQEAARLLGTRGRLALDPTPLRRPGDITGRYPKAVGGFRWEMTLTEAVAACRATGKDPVVVTRAGWTEPGLGCPEPPLNPFGEEYSAELSFCGGALCAINFYLEQSDEPPPRGEALAQRLALKYGPPLLTSGERSFAWFDAGVGMIVIDRDSGSLHYGLRAYGGHAGRILELYDNSY